MLSTLTAVSVSASERIRAGAIAATPPRSMDMALALVFATGGCAVLTHAVIRYIQRGVYGQPPSHFAKSGSTVSRQSVVHKGFHVESVTDNAVCNGHVSREQGVDFAGAGDAPNQVE